MSAYCDTCEHPCQAYRTDEGHYLGGYGEVDYWHSEWVVRSTCCDGEVVGTDEEIEAAIRDLALEREMNAKVEWAELMAGTLGDA